MGMYTELYLAVRLEETTPDEIISALKQLTNRDNDGPITGSYPDHPFFQLPRTNWCLHGDSYYFDAQPFCVFKFDTISKTWFLTFVANIKNYEQQWENFLDWLEPYINSTGHIGHYRYENDDLPTLLLMQEGKIRWFKPENADADKARME